MWSCAFCRFIIFLAIIAFVKLDKVPRLLSALYAYMPCAVFPVFVQAGSMHSSTGTTSVGTQISVR